MTIINNLFPTPVLAAELGRPFTKKEINFEKERILSRIASGDPIDSSQMATFNQKLFEIERLNDLLGPAETIFANTSADTFQVGRDILQKSLDATLEKQKKTGPSGN